MLTTNSKALNQVYNVAFGEQTTLNELVELLKSELAKFDKEIANVKIVYGENRFGDIPHSLASIKKAKNLLQYNPQYSIKKGLEESIKWYVENLK